MGRHEGVAPGEDNSGTYNALHRLELDMRLRGEGKSSSARKVRSIRKIRVRVGSENFEAPVLTHGEIVGHSCSAVLKI